MGRLSGKTALITGATGGIGEATVKRYLEEGANVMAVGRSARKLEDLVQRVGDSDRLDTCVASACDESAASGAVKKTVERFGGLHILFANAGTEGHVKPLDEVTAEDFRAVIETNVVGVWMDMKHAVPAMKKSGGGSIIATSSIAGAIGFPGLIPYIASKHAVTGMVKTAALELGPHKIRVNAIAPGPIANRMMDSIGDQMTGGEHDAFESQISETIALGRYGKNEEVANLAVFLGSDESSYSTGSMFMIDGGFTAA